MTTSKQDVQCTGNLPACHKPPESQDTFDWNNFDDYSVGSSSQGYFSPEYQNGGNTGSEMSFHSNKGQVSSQGMSSTASQTVMNGKFPKNTDKAKQSRRDAYTGQIMPGQNTNSEHSGCINRGGHIVKESGHSARSNKNKEKTTRQRTVLNEKQLTVLHTFYENNCRPDAIMKEQLTTMTGLLQRVIRVWFQNKRCKDKKIAMKQQQEQKMRNGEGGRQQDCGQQKQQKEAYNLNNERNATNQNVNGPGQSSNQSTDINIDQSNYNHQHQPAWKALSDFALQSEIGKPPFQQLVSNFSDQTASLISDSSEVCSIPSVSSHSYDLSTFSCATPIHNDSSQTICS